MCLFKFSVISLCALCALWFDSPSGPLRSGSDVSFQILRDFFVCFVCFVVSCLPPGSPGSRSDVSFQILMISWWPLCALWFLIYHQGHQGHEAMCLFKFFAISLCPLCALWFHSPPGSQGSRSDVSFQILRDFFVPFVRFVVSFTTRRTRDLQVSVNDSSNSVFK